MGRERLPFGMEWKTEPFPEICGPSGTGVHCPALSRGRGRKAGGGVSPWGLEVETGPPEEGTPTTGWSLHGLC